MENKAGKYTFPNLKNIEEAAVVREEGACQQHVSITNPPKKATRAYPISTFTYAIVPHNGAQKGSSSSSSSTR